MHFKNAIQIRKKNKLNILVESHKSTKVSTCGVKSFGLVILLSCLESTARLLGN